MIEYIIWGVPHGQTEETLLYTRSKSLNDAKSVIKTLTTDYGATKCRIQVLNLNEKPDFTKTLNI